MAHRAWHGSAQLPIYLLGSVALNGGRLLAFQPQFLVICHVCICVLRWALEKAGTLDPRVSVLDEEFDEAAVQQEADDEAQRQRAVQEEYNDIAADAGTAGGTEGAPRHREEDLREGEDKVNGAGGRRHEDVTRKDR